MPEQDLIAEARTLIEAATPGPWWVAGTGDIYAGTGNADSPIVAATPGGRDADLIVWMRNRLPLLLAAIVRLEDERDESRADADRAHGQAGALHARVMELRAQVEARDARIAELETGARMDNEVIRQANADRADQAKSIAYLARERDKAVARVAELEAALPYREVWSDETPPGGMVCGTCGQPVESEPCPDHAPKVVCKHCVGAIHQSVKAGGGWVHSDGAQCGLHTCPVDPYGFHAEPVGVPCSDHPANPCLGARGVEVRR
ncbi:hypothetical protein [Nocardia carnea]|uniref:hypothetical protein n=1 Tax=Nocardia carnea TaxID=37328 RepID=UPI0024548800|nr:hypothetical protein [Nocardia carnea]